MTPLERAARALCEAPWSMMLPEERESAFARARAVLAAIREPGDSVLKTLEALMRSFNGDFDGRDDAKEAWGVLIDAALAEEG